MFLRSTKSPEAMATGDTPRAGLKGNADLVLAIDAGTESIRAAVVDAGGKMLGIGRAPVRTTYPAPGQAEQDPAEWESALWVSIREAISASGRPARAIRGLCADGTTSTVVCLDGSDRPVRKALLWSDIRSGEEAGLLGACESPVLARAGGGDPSSEWFPCKALWIKRHEPEAWNRTATIFELTDWLAWRLTGERALNLNTAVLRGFFDGRNGQPPSDLYRAAGLEDLAEKLPTKTARPGEWIGGLSAEAADLTGLPRGLPVAAGGGDAFIGAIGLNALEPGRIALITGSSHVITAHVEHPMHVDGLFGTFPDALYPGSFMLEGGLASTGSVLRWFTENFIGEKICAAARGAGKTSLAYLDELAAAISPGSEGVTVLEHWQGSRCPWVDPASRGVIRGLTLLHGPAHLYRAIMEAVAFGISLILDRMESAGVPIKEIRVCGGPSRSPIWMQIHADVLGTPIMLPREPESVLLGSAMLAALGAGMYPRLVDAAEAMSETAGLIQPAPDAHSAYRKLKRRYISTYEALEPVTRSESMEIRT